jgi:hypothetical protein
MNIIFLDIDGVLNSLSWAIVKDHKHKLGIEKFSNEELSFFNLEVLAVIVKKCNAHIVVSSSWRTTGAPVIKDCLEKHWGLGNRVIGVTPDVCPYRGTEIYEYFVRNEYNVDVESFLILDDEIDIDMNPYMDRLLIIDQRYGLQGVHIEAAAKILKRPVKWDPNKKWFEVK